MSQFYQGVTSGSLPPSVPTSFTADDSTIAVPVAGNLNVFSRDTIDDNVNGIQTTVDPNGSANLYVELTNRITVTATTSDGAGQTQTVSIFTPPVSTGITFTVSIIGYDSINNEVSGGELIGIARNSSIGTVAVIGTNDTFDESDAGLVTTDWDIVTNGTMIQIQFVGVAGRSVSWNAVFSYNKTP